jgi:pilus assembly protein FimV
VRAHKAKIARSCLAISLLFCLAGVPAYAVSLGNIEVKSGLNERFAAQIVLNGLVDGELDTLYISLADDEAFERVGLTREYLLTQLKFEVVTTGARSGYIKISSRSRIREPSLSLVVQLATATRVINRRYDVLLDRK